MLIVVVINLILLSSWSMFLSLYKLLRIYDDKILNAPVISIGVATQVECVILDTFRIIVLEYANRGRAYHITIGGHLTITMALFAPKLMKGIGTQIY